jgi:hypothetical protein
MINDCIGCEEEKGDLVYMRYEIEDGMCCPDCREKIANGAMSEYYSEEIDYYYTDLEFIEELLEIKLRRQTQDGYGVCNICGKNRAFGHCSCV